MLPIIIIPYRNREKNLKTLVPVLRQFVADARIVVIEQGDDMPFNKGWLFNAAFLETFPSVTDADAVAPHYWILHDVDMVPATGKVDYSYCAQPTLLATQASQFGYRTPYAEFFGGVVVLTAEHVRSINGFPNNMLGWGCEDDMLYRSLVAKDYKPQQKQCRFESLPHERHVNNAHYQRNLNILLKGRDFTDGITNCRYTVAAREMRDGYEWVKVVP